MKHSRLLLILLFLIVSLQIQAQPTPDFEKIDTYFELMVKAWDVPGASIGIVKNGELIFTGNYGEKEIGEGAEPNENTLYAIASNSKAFTSAVIGMLVEEGKLNWEDKVKDHLPYFSLFDNPWISGEVTILDLLSHRVGLGTFSGDIIWYKSEASAEEIIRNAANVPQAYGFRAGYGYSNLMYITAGEIIQKVTGKSWGQNVKERILNPLGMQRTLVTAKGLKNTDNIVTPHGREENKNFPIAFEDWETIGATGGVISSVSDMAKWMIFNLNHGIHNKDTLLSTATRNKVWTMHNVHGVDHTKGNDLGRHFNGYGLGWTIGDFKGNFMVGHTGGFDGMITAVTLIPDEKLGVVVLTNGHKSPIMAATYYALDQMLGTGEKDWSADILLQINEFEKKESRVTSIKNKRMEGTQPTLDLDDFVGNYESAIYGDISVSKKDEVLRLEFDDAPRLNANLKHWHYDTFEIVWDEKHAWFDFGTVKFNSDNNMKVIGMDFEVPNDDIFFEELKPKKVK